MKFLNWMQSKFNAGGQVAKRPDPVTSTKIMGTDLVMSTNHYKKSEEIGDWPHGLLAIGTFGNVDLAEKEEEVVIVEEQCSSPDFSEFTVEEVNKLQKELKKLLNKKPVAEEPITDLPLDRFLNCPSSLEVDRVASNRFSTYSDDKGEEEIDRTIRIILGRCKDVCEKKKKKKKDIGKKSLSFLVKKVFACRSGLTPGPSLRDTFQESRMEKLMRTMLANKIFPQNSSRTPSAKNYIEDNRHTSKSENDQDYSMSNKSREGSSKWDKTDSEYIVLEI